MGRNHIGAVHVLRLQRDNQTLHETTCLPMRENGGWDGWTIEQLSTTRYDPELTPDLPRYMETMAIKSLQRAGHCQKKCLDMCLLKRIQKETSNFLPDWAYGFIEGRSCRHALLTATMLDQRVLALQGAMELAMIELM